MKKRILAVIALVLLFGGTTLAFGYWDNLSTSQTDQTLVIGEGTTLTVATGVHTNPGETLVPSTVILGANDITSYEITYSVELSKEAATALNLSVVVSNLKINSVASTNGDIINVAVDAPTTINNSAVTVTITVTFVREPVDSTEYAAVGGKDITFDLSFTAAQ